MRVATSLPPTMSSIAALSSSGNADQCSPRRTSNGRPSTNVQMLRSARRKNPSPPSTLVASAMSAPLSTQSSPLMRFLSSRRSRSSRRCRCSSRAGATLGVDNQQRPLPVEQERRALGGADVGRVGELEARRVGKDVGDDDTMREVVGLDPSAAELEQVLDRLGDEFGGLVSGPAREVARQDLARDGIAEGAVECSVDGDPVVGLVAPECHGGTQAGFGHHVEEFDQCGAFAGRDEPGDAFVVMKHDVDPPAGRTRCRRRRTVAVDRRVREFDVGAERDIGERGGNRVAERIRGQVLDGRGPQPGHARQSRG